MRLALDVANRRRGRVPLFQIRHLVARDRVHDGAVHQDRVVVFGGGGNLVGTLVGALALGVFNKFLEPYSGAVLAKILVLVVVILFIQRRPRGLFALKGRAVEN